MGDETTADGAHDAPVATSEAARPEESRRDPEQTRIDIERWLATKLPAGAEPLVDAVHVPERNGMSSETVLVDASWIEDGDRGEHPLVFRIAPDAAAVPVFQDYDFPSQFKVMAKVRELSDVPVPEVHWLEMDDSHIGAPFFVMSRAYGVVPQDVLPYPFGDNWLFDATPEDQQRLVDSSIDALVRLHAIAEPASHFDFLETGSEGDTPLRRHVADLRGYYDWVCKDGVRTPVLERAFDWLEANWPEDEGESVLSWGDARIGNTMYDDFEPVAVLDWEMAAIAPREVDLGWMIYIHRFFQDIVEIMELPGMPDFLRRDDVEAAYRAKSGYEPRDMDFYTLYAALRYGVVAAQVQRRAIAFGQAEQPEDPDELVMNRQALEDMMAGTYWSKVL
jgi:aminoglycoside phosphotransferase (APT) family kinase protein